MQTQLTSQDITLLIESLEAWVSQPNTTGFMTDIMMTVLCGPRKEDNDFEDAKRKSLRESERRQAQAKIAYNARKEQSVLLHAKLITLRNELQAKELAQ